MHFHYGWTEPLVGTPRRGILRIVRRYCFRTRPYTRGVITDALHPRSHQGTEYG